MQRDSVGVVSSALKGARRSWELKTPGPYPRPQGALPLLGRQELLTGMLCALDVLFLHHDPEAGEPRCCLEEAVNQAWNFQDKHLQDLFLHECWLQSNREAQARWACALLVLLGGWGSPPAPAPAPLRAPRSHKLPRERRLSLQGGGCSDPGGLRAPGVPVQLPSKSFSSAGSSVGT